MNLRKTFFILPNLFTLSSVFCGFLAVTLCSTPSTSMEELQQAAISICFAFFFDLADGRVARLTKTQSALGMQLDSLADVISFGVAPALLVYKWGLGSLGRAGVFIGFLFCGAAALRLARFNVLSMKDDHSDAKPGKYIIGLPVPTAAAVLVSILLAHRQLGGSFVEVEQGSLALLVVVLSYLMVSRIRFRSFKDLRFTRRTVFGALVGLCFTGVALLEHMRSAFLFVALVTCYVGLGLMEEVVFYRRRREEEQAAKSPQMTFEAEGGARSDHEVLAELGAFDHEDTGSGKPPPSEPPPAHDPTVVKGS